MAETLYSDELVDGVRLALVSGVGPRHRQDLLGRFGSPAAVLATGKAELQEVSGIGPKIAARILACGLPVHRALSTISVLEMRRLVRRISGTQVARI